MSVMIKREFGVAPELRKLYLVYLTGLITAGFLWWVIPLIVALTIFIDPFIGMIVALFTLITLSAIVAVVLYWIPKFISSVRYSLEDDRIVTDKGVWWKTKSVVPYNRITNINIYQGPISRHFGLGRLAIHTAGFSADEAETEGYRNVNEAMLNELKRIRKAVEKET
jgi:membrane protein YdbS with pleckstrin-like domain